MEVNRAKWRHPFTVPYGVCSNRPEQNSKALTFNIYTVDYPCRMVIVDSKQREYTF